MFQIRTMDSTLRRDTGRPPRPGPASETLRGHEDSRGRGRFSDQASDPAPRTNITTVNWLTGGSPDGGQYSRSPNRRCGR
ncbi:hypothetical protein AAFF_G00309940 [Aldrovandia affinis]|uniref:Uncharacterized protein n=1 Tax=Aldrovandia affinis TaxID=143900 RepID=A0AAD7WQW8_9TELE|nr:hypothetical protein AAFF_G00309940 [Aldrovandia affinis]